MATIPGAAIYGQHYAQANEAYQNALARIGNRRSQLLRQYGYEADFDPNGHMSNLRVSANNPSGQYQQMLASQAHDLNAAEDARNASGFGGGLVQHGLHELHDAQGAQSAQLGQSLLDAAGGLEDEQSQAHQTFNDTLYEDQLQAARDAIEQGNFDPAAVDDPENPPIPQDLLAPQPGQMAQRVRARRPAPRRPAPRPRQGRAQQVVRQQMARHRPAARRR